MMTGGWKIEPRTVTNNGAQSTSQQGGGTSRSNSSTQYKAGGGGGGSTYNKGGTTSTATTNAGGPYNKGTPQNDNHFGQQSQGGQSTGGKIGKNPYPHPMVTTMMKPYFDKFGTRVQLNDICTGANTRINQLPYLNRFIVENRNMLCYPYLLGHCSYNKCRFEHPPTHELPTGFIAEVCQAVRPGVEYVVRNGLTPPRGGSPKKQRR